MTKYFFVNNTADFTENKTCANIRTTVIFIQYFICPIIDTVFFRCPFQTELINSSHKCFNAFIFAQSLQILYRSFTTNTTSIFFLSVFVYCRIFCNYSIIPLMIIIFVNYTLSFIATVFACIFNFTVFNAIRLKFIVNAAKIV